MSKRLLHRMLVVGLGMAGVISAGITPMPATAQKCPAPPPSPQAVAQRMATKPIRFEPNKGQASTNTQFIARGLGYHLSLNPKGATFAFSPPMKRGAIKMHDFKFQHPKTTTLQMHLEGAGQPTATRGENALPGVTNYFHGQNRSKWIQGLTSFGKVRYSNIYKGIDLVYYGNQRQLEYDFVVSPHISSDTIRLRFTGSQSVKVSPAGDLKIRMAGKEVQWHKPFAYQTVGNQRQEVKTHYLKHKDGSIGFQVARYDVSRPLIIDPVFTYSSFLGGNSNDSATAIAMDATGNVYITGYTNSDDLPLVAPANTGAYLGGYEAFLTKLDKNGQVVINEYFGGSRDDLAYSIALDQSATPKIYIAGTTSSLDLPVTRQGKPNGAYNAFVTVFDTTGVPQITQYIGGEANDVAYAVAVNDDGNPKTANTNNSKRIVVTGSTASKAFPTTSNAFQKKPGGDFDGFLIYLDLGLVPFYSTYVGKEAEDSITSLALDAKNNAYIGGYTTSSAFPTTSTAPLKKAMGGYDGFVMRFNALGKPTYSTLLGGGSDDIVYYLVVDGSGIIYATGKTFSDDFPATPDAFQSFRAGWADAFVTLIDPASRTFPYSTFIGGEGDDAGLGIALYTPAGKAPNIVLTGYTYSLWDPVIPFPLQGAEQVSPGEYEGFLLILDGGNNYQLLESTALGGAQDDMGSGVAVNPTGTVAWVVGTTYSDDFPTTDGSPGTDSATSPFYGGGTTDSFVTRFVPAPQLTAFNMPTNTASVGQKFAASVTFNVLVPKALTLGYRYVDETETVYLSGSFDVPQGTNVKTDLVYKFNVPTPPLQDTKQLRLIVSFLGYELTQVVTVVAPQVIQVQFPDDVANTVPCMIGGQSLLGTIVLDQKATANTNIQLTTTQGVSCPATVTVKRGTDRATFKLKASVLSSDTSITLTATSGESSVTRTIWVLVPRTVSLKLDPATVKGGDTTNGTSTAKVTLSPALPGDANTVFKVDFSSSSTIAQIPSGALVRFTGGASTGTLKITPSAVTTKTKVDVTASFYGKRKTVYLTVTP